MSDVGGLKDLCAQVANVFGAAVVYVCGRVVADAGVAVLVVVLMWVIVSRGRAG